MSSELQKLEAELDRRVNPEKSRKFNPERLFASRDILERILAHPELEPGGERFALVGSNGKGSTAFYLAMIARSTGETVGLFTSPHLRSVLERIRVNGRPVSPRLAWRALELVRACSGEDWEHLSYFELTFLMACAVFRMRGCTTQIFEAGLGGRWDATRAAMAQNVLLLPIELEHTDLLGNSRPSIAREKLAILTPHTRRLLAYPQPRLPDRTIRHLALEAAPGLPRIHFIDTLTGVSPNTRSYLEINFRFASFCYKTATGRKIPPELKDTTSLPAPPGRLTRRTTRLTNAKGKPIDLFFDPAHNLPGMSVSLAAVYSTGFHPKEGLVLLGVLPDRDLSGAQALIKSQGLDWRVLTADFLTSPLPADQNRALALETLGDSLPGVLDGSRFSFCVFLGTHRTYVDFKRVTRQLRPNSG